jgi:cytochrome b561
MLEKHEISLRAGKSAASRQYTPLAQGLHWLTALLIFAILAIAWMMVDLPKDDPDRDTLFMIHKSLGVTVFVLAALRMVWRAANPPPPLPGRLARWEALLAKISHFLLYFILLAMPISGYILSAASNHPVIYFDLFQLPLLPENKPLSKAAEFVHVSLQWAVYALIILHVLATTWHLTVRRDGILNRMLPRQINEE